MTRLKQLKLNIYFILAVILPVSCGTGNAWVSSSLKGINPKKCAIEGFDFRDTSGAGLSPIEVANKIGEEINRQLAL